MEYIATYCCYTYVLGGILRTVLSGVSIVANPRRGGLFLPFV